MNSGDESSIVSKHERSSRVFTENLNTRDDVANWLLELQLQVKPIYILHRDNVVEENEELFPG